MRAELAIIALVVGVIGYIPYYRNLFRGKTKPHAFTFFIWGLLTAIAFFAQLHGNAGAGAWVTGLAALSGFAVFAIALKVGRSNIVTVDWFFFIGALACLGVWAITDDPTGAVILITIIDALAFVPTFRKSWHKPYDETIFSYGLASLKFVFAIAALDVFSITTVLYPLSLVITNGLFVAFVMYRRAQLSRQSLGRT